MTVSRQPALRRLGSAFLRRDPSRSEGLTSAPACTGAARGGDARDGRHAAQGHGPAQRRDRHRASGGSPRGLMAATGPDMLSICQQSRRTVMPRPPIERAVSRSAACHAVQAGRRPRSRSGAAAAGRGRARGDPAGRPRGPEPRAGGRGYGRVTPDRRPRARAWASPRRRRPGRAARPSSSAEASTASSRGSSAARPVATFGPPRPKRRRPSPARRAVPPTWSPAGTLTGPAGKPTEAGAAAEPSGPRAPPKAATSAAADGFAASRDHARRAHHLTSWTARPETESEPHD